MRRFIKLILALTTLLYFKPLLAQDESMDNTKMMSVFNAMQASSNASLGNSVYFVNPKRTIEGTVYLFDTWDNYGVIHTTDHQKLALYNINLNIKRNTFESKIGKDSIYAFNFNNIDKFVINGRTFKNYYWDNDNRVYEVIAKGKNYEILKGFSIKYVEGSPNPMLNRKSDRYVRNEKYYLRKDNKIVFFNLKKSRVLKLMNLDELKKNKVLTFAEERKLSFKKEADVRKIIAFASGLK